MRKSWLSQYKQNKLIELFVARGCCTYGSRIGRCKQKILQPNYFHRLCLLIFQNCPMEMLDGEIEVDESYFGGQRKEKRGRGVAGKVTVFGFLTRNGRVYTVAVPNTTTTLLPALNRTIFA